ncbi:hypothetical protein VPHD148_0231 [Vibrio phage D148]
MLQCISKVTEKLHDKPRRGLASRRFATLQHYFRVFIYTCREMSTWLHIYT